MEREISSQIFVIEERIGMLATAVSLAPFLGLFGTVWGVMIAFCGVASAGSANIQALAPGVAGALLTTVAGLVVAIPSLVGYNFLTQMIRKITVSMDNFSESFMARLKLEQLNAKENTPAATPPQNTPNSATQASGNLFNRPTQYSGSSAAQAQAGSSWNNTMPHSTPATQSAQSTPAVPATTQIPDAPAYQQYRQMTVAPVQTQPVQTQQVQTQPQVHPHAPAAPAGQVQITYQAPQYHAPAPMPAMPQASTQMSFNDIDKSGNAPDDSMRG
jgi:hypothetical protein